MPHRAGYFALAYSWDHHCEGLMRSVGAGFAKLHGELAQLMGDTSETPEELLSYYKKWHYNYALYHHLVDLIKRKVFTINSLGYRGYGTNQDLAEALETVKEREAELLGSLLDQTFFRKTDLLRRTIYLPPDRLDQRDSTYIISELCRSRGLTTDGQVPRVLHPVVLNLDHYYKTMSDQTSWQTNTAIFQRLFLKSGTSSATLMEGSTGLHTGTPVTALKAVANENFRRTSRYIFETLHDFTAIGLDLLKHLHHLLCEGLDLEAGQFRRIDFPDRNGVTFEFNNLDREIADLGWVLTEAADSFQDLAAFIRNLSRSYYMFIGIHPFWDANGRVGRVFLNQMFMKKGLPPVSFYDKEEIFALPRYGGVMDDMHEYIKSRIVRGVDDYFYERNKIEAVGALNSRIYNVSFDSGFLFCQIDQEVQRIEVQFEVLVVEDSGYFADHYRNTGRIVLSSDFALYNMSIFYGYSDTPGGYWVTTRRLQHGFYIAERGSEMEGVRAFDVEFVVKRDDADRGLRHFNCSLAHESGGLVFNNKGLNYRYDLE
jgi:hypothetical protein